MNKKPEQKSVRAGVYQRQPTGYWAFVPAELPPVPSVVSRELTRHLSDADLALGRLDGIIDFIPNPELFVAMYVRKEAVLSSQIEGTQASLDDVLEFEAGLEDDGDHALRGVDEVLNYIDAMNFGLSRLSTLPMSLRLIREIHKHLLHGVRGQDKTPGAFRTTQNWIGPSGTPLSRAEFIPPPPNDVMRSMGNLEKFIRADNDNIPILIRCAVSHAQFETIHPFLDGNGRIGRLLITFMLCERSVLRKPLLYLSLFLKEHRSEYYQRLMEVRLRGDWEGWIGFFLEGVREVSQKAFNAARQIDALRKEVELQIQERLPRSQYAIPFARHIFDRPLLNASGVTNAIDATGQTAYALLESFVSLGILEETTGRQRNRRYRFSRYLDILSPK